MLCSLPSYLQARWSNVTSFRAEEKSLRRVLVHFSVISIWNHRYSLRNVLNSVLSQMWCRGSLPLLCELLEPAMELLGRGLQRQHEVQAVWGGYSFLLRSVWRGGHYLKVNILSTFQTRSHLKCHNICSPSKWGVLLPLLPCLEEHSNHSSSL